MYRDIARQNWNWLNMFFFFLGQLHRENVALNKPAYQISTEVGGNALLAVDGSKDTRFWIAGVVSCTHTADSHTQPWWKVDLGRKYTISYVTYTNRGHYGK